MKFSHRGFEEERSDNQEIPKRLQTQNPTGYKNEEGASEGFRMSPLI